MFRLSFVIVACAVMSLAGAHAFGQLAEPAAKQQADAPPATKIEAFQRQTGSVVVKAYTEMGSVSSTGKVSVDAMEFTNALTNEKEYGIRIEVTEAGRLERDNASFVDYDEIDGLLAGIDYVSKITGAVSKFKNFEAIYSTKGDFKVIVFNSSSGALSVGVSSGRFGAVTAYLDIKELPKVRALIAGAKATIDANKK